MKSEIETITPAKAAKFLQSNHSNRAIRSTNVKAFAQAIKDGRWLKTHQGIAFDVNGRLIDGQHRLSAIVMANIPVEMLVSRDVVEDAFKVTDSGAKRNIGDWTGFDRRTAEVCKFIGTFIGISDERRYVTPDDVIRIAKSGVKEVHAKLIEFCPTNTRTFSSSPCRAAVVVRSLMVPEDEDFSFLVYQSLIKQEYKSMNSAAESLCRQERLKSGFTFSEQSELFVKMLKVVTPKNSELLKIVATPQDIDRAKEQVGLWMNRNIT